MLTKYMNFCIFCGKPTTTEHHLVYGKGKRPLADADELVIPICQLHHNDIHAQGTSGKLSKMLGQMAFERDRCAEGKSIDESRELFRKRYGESYL